MFRSLVLASATAALVAVAPSSALAASPPGVNTGGASKVTSTSAHLSGTINPRGQGTTYSFQYGTTTKYGGTTPAASAGAGTKAIAVGADIGGLQGAKTYHYRLVASSPGGVVSGSDRTFKTDKVPLSLSLVATPNPVRYGAAATLSGTLAGTGGGGQTVQLQLNPFPYTGGFMNAALSPVVTGAAGNFTMVLAGLTANAQARVVTKTGKAVTSPPIMLGVSPVVRTAVSTHHPRRGAFVRFAGTVSPSFVPAQVAIQRLSSKGAWITVAGNVTRAYKADRSRYAKSARVRSAGTYRVFVGLLNSQFAGAVGPSIRISPR
jgi:hypothetical protein